MNPSTRFHALLRPTNKPPGRRGRGGRSKGPLVGRRRGGRRAGEWPQRPPSTGGRAEATGGGEERGRTARRKVKREKGDREERGVQGEGGRTGRRREYREEGRQGEFGRIGRKIRMRVALGDVVCCLGGYE